MKLSLAILGLGTLALAACGTDADPSGDGESGEIEAAVSATCEVSTTDGSETWKYTLETTPCFRAASALAT